MQAKGVALVSKGFAFCSERPLTGVAAFLPRSEQVDRHIDSIARPHPMWDTDRFTKEGVEITHWRETNGRIPCAPTRILDPPDFDEILIPRQVGAIWDGDVAD
jgi:hypothetical protein